MKLTVPSFIVATVLVVAPMPAWGACAWVLWSNLISSNPSSRYEASSGGLWTPETAGTRTDCERARDRMRVAAVQQQAMGPGTQALAPETASVGVIGPNGQTYLTCLPDTIDPRGPKGGGR